MAGGEWDEELRHHNDDPWGTQARKDLASGRKIFNPEKLHNILSGWQNIDIYRDIYLKNHRKAVFLKDDKDSATRQNFIRIQSDIALKLSGNSISRAEAEKWGRRLWEARRIDAANSQDIELSRAMAEFEGTKWIHHNQTSFWQKVQSAFYNRLRGRFNLPLTGEKIRITNLDNPSTLPKGALSAQNVYKYFAKASQSDISGNPRNYTKPVVVHDIETGAVVKNRSEVLSIGAIKFVYNKGLNRLEVLDTYERYYMPTVTSGSGWENAFRVHNMSPQLIASLRQQQEAKGIHYNGIVNYNDKAMLEYRQWMGHNVTLAGHNSDAFDNLQLFGENQGGYRALDTLKASRNMAYFAKGWSSKSGNKLDQVFKRLFGKTMEESGLPHHDAMSDVIATSMVLNKMANMNNKVGDSIRYILDSDHPDRHLTYFDNMMDSMVYKGEFQKGPTNVKSLVDRFEYHIPIAGGNMAKKRNPDSYKIGDKYADMNSWDGSENNWSSWGDIGQLSPEDFDRGFTVETNGKGVHSSSKRHQNEEDRMDQLGNLYMWLAEKNETGAMPDDLFKFARKALNMNEASKQAESRASLKAESMMDLTSQLLHMQNMNRNMQYISRLGHFIDLTNVMPLASNKEAQEYLKAVAPSWDQSKLYNAAVDYKLARTRETLSDKDWKAFYGGKITEEQRQQLEGEYRNAPKHDAMLEGFIKANKSMDKLSDSTGSAASGLERLGNVLHDLTGGKDIKFYNPHNLIDEPESQFKSMMGAWDWLPKGITKPIMRMGDFVARGTENKFAVPFGIYDIGKSLNLSLPKMGRSIGGIFDMVTNPVAGGIDAATSGMGEGGGGTSLGMGRKIGGMVGNGINAISQIGGGLFTHISKFNMNRLQMAGDLLGAGYDILSVPFKMLAQVAKSLVSALSHLGVSIKKFISDMMQAMARLGTPLTNLTGVNYSQYQTLGNLDTLFGFGKGTLNSMFESTANQQHMLYAMGDYNLDRMKNAAVLGVFSEAYSPGASFDKIVDKLAAKNLTPQQMAQAAQIDQNLPQVLQVMSDLGVKSMSTLTDPSYLAQRGVFFRPMSPEERKAYRVDAFEFDAISTNISNSKMRIADMMWNGFGKNIYNGFNEALDILSRNPADWKGAFDAVKKSFSSLWDSIVKISGSESKNVKDVFSSLWDKFRTEILGMKSNGALVDSVKDLVGKIWDKAYPTIASAFMKICHLWLQGLTMAYGALRPIIIDMLSWTDRVKVNPFEVGKMLLGMEHGPIFSMLSDEEIRKGDVKKKNGGKINVYGEYMDSNLVNVYDENLDKWREQNPIGSMYYNDQRATLRKGDNIRDEIRKAVAEDWGLQGFERENLKDEKNRHRSWVMTLSNEKGTWEATASIPWTGNNIDIEEMTDKLIKEINDRRKQMSAAEWDAFLPTRERFAGYIDIFESEAQTLVDSISTNKPIVNITTNTKLYYNNKEEDPDRISEDTTRRDRLESFIRNRASSVAEGDYAPRWHKGAVS